jgi:hypothetical protein
MRVKIEQLEKTFTKAKERGFFNSFKEPETYPVWVVSVQVDLSEEERAILTQRKLWPKVLYTHEFSAEHFQVMSSEEMRLLGDVTSVPITIENFFERPTHDIVCYDPVEAKNFAHKMQHEILPRLKSFIQASAEIGSTTTFEL